MKHFELAMKKWALLAVLCAVAFVAVVSADAKADMKQACDLCANIGMGGGKNKFVCPKSAVKDCQININGWCCHDKKVNKQCKPCSGIDVQDLDEDDEEDDD